MKMDKEVVNQFFLFKAHLLAKLKFLFLSMTFVGTLPLDAAKKGNKLLQEL